jgi:RNA polymerase sigma-70 factor (ECF subfamily)
VKVLHNYYTEIHGDYTERHREFHYPPWGGQGKRYEQVQQLFERSPFGDQRAKVESERMQLPIFICSVQNFYITLRIFIGDYQKHFAENIYVNTYRMVNEQQYVSDLAAGSHSAFRKVFMEFFPKIKAFIFRIIKDESVAEELAQDIFLKIWEHRQSLTATQSLNAYIYRMAKNAAFNYLEHRLVTDRYAFYMRNAEPDNCSVEDDLYAREMEAVIQNTVERFPPQRKLVFTMSRFQGLKNDEIAAQLNLSKKTIENHLTLALNEIRKVIGLMTALLSFLIES